MGMPGFSGFPAELTILSGTWQVSKIWAVGAALGVLIAAAFTLRVMQISFLAKYHRRAKPARGDPLRTDHVGGTHRGHFIADGNFVNWAAT